MRNILDKKKFQEIEDRLNEIKRDDMPIWGKMNVNEMLCHCADQVKLALGEITVKDESTFARRNIIKNLLFMGMPVPKGKIKTFDEVNPHATGSKPVSFEADKNYLLRKLEDFVNSKEDSLQPHGAFGKLSKKQWGKLIYIHMNHHLNQFGS